MRATHSYTQDTVNGPGPDLSQAVRRIPKIELHQHVDGSIPIPITWELMTKHGLSPVDTVEDMERLLTLQPEEEGTLIRYLDKFHYPAWITQFYGNITRVVEAIVAEAATHGVTALELRYSPIIHTYAGLTFRQAISAVLSGLNHAEDRHGVRTGLIIIAMRHQGPHIAKILARQAISEAQHLHSRTGVIGFDLAGAERGNPPRLFKEAYDIASKGGLGLTVHAGEDEGPDCIWQALDVLGVTRIGHGCSAVQDPALVKRLAADRVMVECCLTSNYHTGAVKRGQPHPIFAFLEAGVPVSVCTDNTTVSRTNQTAENTRLAETLALSEIAEIHDRARAHSFIRDVRSSLTPAVEPP
jgi:adenosine deaminase